MGNFYPTSKKRGIKTAAVLSAFTLFSGLASAQYCTTGGPSSGSDSNVESVLLNGNASSINFTGTCPGITGVEDQTALSADLSIGNSYSVEVEYGTCGGSYSGAGTVWIDWNQDQVFDASEEVGTWSGSPTALEIHNFTVPSGAMVGTTRMRVMQRESGSLPLDPCGSYLWGSVIDFNITVNPGATDDAALGAIAYPSTACGLTTDSVGVTLLNPGINAIDSLHLNYSINGGPVSSDTLSGLGLASGGSLTHTFSMFGDFTTPGTYTIMAWVDYDLDAQSANDTVMLTIENIPVLNNFPYLEDFENGMAAYSAGGSASSWEFGNPSNSFISSAASGDSAWVTNLTGNYNSSENSWVESPCFDFTSYTVDPSLRFSFIMNGESCCDESWIEVSDDAGATWSKLGSAATGTSGWYNDTSNEWWDGDHDNGQDYITSEHVLTGLAGSSDVKIRWVFSSDGSVQYEGVGFDDVTISTYPEVALGPNDTLCVDTTYMLGLGTGTYEWSLDGQVVSSDSSYTFTNSVQVVDTLMLTFTNPVGFSSSDTVEYYYVPVVNLGADEAVCDGDELPLDATLFNENGPIPSLLFNWSTGSASSNIDAATAGTYSVTVTDPVSGCVSEDEMVLTVNANPVPNIGADTSICEGAILILDPGMWQGYSWNNGSNSQQVIVNTTGSYSVDVTDDNGCTGSDNIIVSVNPTPVIEIGNDTVVGAGYVFNLDAGLGYNSYLWSNNTSDPTATIIADEPQVIFVRVVDAFGCTGYDEFKVDIALGAEELHNAQAFNVFPNPVKNSTQVQFELKQFSDVEIQLFDIQGRVVFNQKESLSQGAYTNPLDLSSVEAGTYILTLKVNGEMAAQTRIVKM